MTELGPTLAERASDTFRERAVVVSPVHSRDRVAESIGPSNVGLAVVPTALVEGGMIRVARVEVPGGRVVRLFEEEVEVLCFTFGIAHFHPETGSGDMNDPFALERRPRLGHDRQGHRVVP